MSGCTKRPSDAVVALFWKYLLFCGSVSEGKPKASALKLGKDNNHLCCLPLKIDYPARSVALKFWLIEIIVLCIIGRTVFQHSCKNYTSSLLSLL